MPIKIAALLVAAGAWLGAFAMTSSAAACGSAGAPPCKPDRVQPKPVATERIGKTPPSGKTPQSGKTGLIEPAKRAAQPAPATAARSGDSKARDKEPDSGAAVDVKLSKIPDIIAPEPKGEARPSAPMGEPEAEAGVAPVPRSEQTFIRRHDPMP